jgi:hypothetical protein
MKWIWGWQVGWSGEVMGKILTKGKVLAGGPSSQVWRWLWKLYKYMEPESEQEDKGVM